MSEDNANLNNSQDFDCRPRNNILDLLFAILSKLASIKAEVRHIEECVCPPPVPPVGGTAVTTGPVIRDGNGNQSVNVKVLNNTDVTRTVTVRLYNLGTCPKTFVTSQDLILHPCCAAEITPIPLGEGQGAITNFEVQIAGVVNNVFGFVTVTTGGSANLSPANTFKAAELLPSNQTCHSQ